jgi:hypothetical protein
MTEPGQWPMIFAAKMGLVALLFSLTLLHDLVVGPRVRLILGTTEMERSAADRVLLRYSSLLPRLSLLVALVVMLAAVILARS